MRLNSSWVAQKHTLHTLTPTNCLTMGSVYMWKLSSQKLGFFLVSFGFIWGMMLLHFTIQQRATHESSAQLRMQILDLSKRYIKALAEENQSVMDGPYVGTMTAYGKSSNCDLSVKQLQCECMYVYSFYFASLPCTTPPAWRTEKCNIKIAVFAEWL